MGNILLLLIFVLFPMLEIDGQISLTPEQKCVDLVDLRVVNGVKTNAYNAPWHAILELKEQSKSDKIINHCGGSILTPTIILTAAHCIWQNELHPYTRDHLCPIHVRNHETTRECHELPGGCPAGCTRIRPEDLNVYVGVTSIRQPVRIPLEVKSIILHPGWNKTSSNLNSVKNGHDLAMVVLQTKLQFSTKINSICLPDEKFHLESGQNVSVNGFGNTETDGTFSRTPADILQRGDLQFKTKESCMADYEKINKPEIIQGDQICAYSTSTPQTDTCQGDSGGGLLTFVGSAPVLVGVVSFGHTKCQDLPGVYTNIHTHMDWIQQQWHNCSNTGTPSNNDSFLDSKQSERSSTMDEFAIEDQTVDCEVGEEYENNCYLLIKSPLDWLGAASDCRARNGILVTIKDSGINAFIANNITNGEPAWITTYGPVWKWSDGEIIGTFVAGSTIQTEFIEGEDLSCVYLNYKSPGKWSNDYCGTALPYVCQGQKLLIGCGGGSHGIPCCPEYMYGDGKGGRQQKINFSPRTEAGCQRSCRDQHPTSIGVTQTHDGTSKCYCEFGSPKLGGNANKRKTCLFPTARTVDSYEELEDRPAGMAKPARTGTGVGFQGSISAGLPSFLNDYDFRSVDDEPVTVKSCPQTTCQVGDNCCNLVYNPRKKKFECPAFC